MNKFISIRSLVKNKRLGYFSEGARPLTYVTILKRVRDHIKNGNGASIEVMTEKETNRLIIRESDIETFVTYLWSYYGDHKEWDRAGQSEQNTWEANDD